MSGPIVMRTRVELSELLAALALIESHRRYADDPDDAAALMLDVVRCGKGSTRIRVSQTIKRLGTQHFDCGLSWDREPSYEDVRDLERMAIGAVRRAWGRGL